MKRSSTIINTKTETMKLQNLSAEMIRILPKGALALKYNCSVQYVRKVLQGKSGCKSPRARAIVQDALDIYRILERQPQISGVNPLVSYWYTSQTNNSKDKASASFYSCKSL